MATPEEMEAKMVANLKENTGKTLAQWLKITSKSGLAKHGELVKLLKTEHGIYAVGSVLSASTSSRVRPV